LLRLFRNKLFLLILATVVVFIVMGISTSQDSKINWFGNAIDAAFSPVQKLISTVGRKVNSYMSLFSDMKSLKAENEELKIKVERLEKENGELAGYREKNKELREALNLKDQFKDYDSIGANVIAKDPGNWFNIFTVDRGKNDGISNNFPVITGKGLVGSVYSAGLFSSKVVTIIDMDSTVSGRISKTRDLVRVKGDINLKDQGLCRMDYISPDIDISVGDTVETSGLGGIFPKGIIIGRIKEIRQVNNELSRYAVIEPAVDFKRLEEVIILKSKNNVGPESTGK